MPLVHLWEMFYDHWSDHWVDIEIVMKLSCKCNPINAPCASLGDVLCPQLLLPMRTYFVAKLNEWVVKLRQKITNIWKTTKPSLLAWSLEKRTYLTWAPICSDTAETTGIRGTRWICDDPSEIIFSSNTELKLGLWLWMMLNMDLNPFLPQSLKLGDKWKHGSSIQWMEQINTKEKDLLRTTSTCGYFHIFCIIRRLCRFSAELKGK